MKRIVFGIILLSSCNSNPVLKDSIQNAKPTKIALKKSMTLWISSSKWVKEKKEEYREYSPQEDLTKWIQYTKEGDICDQFEYVYKGTQKMQENRKYCTGKLESTTIYHYDSLNRIRKEEILDEKGKLNEFTVHGYSGNRIKPSSIESQNVKDSAPYSRTEYTYFPSGLLKEEVQTCGGSWFGTNTYKYDQEGNMIYMGAQVDGGVGLVEYHYIYDKGILVKDSVNIPDTRTEYHIYEYQFY